MWSTKSINGKLCGKLHIKQQKSSCTSIPFEFDLTITILSIWLVKERPLFSGHPKNL